MSKTVKANNYAQALKTAQAYEENNGSKSGSLTGVLKEQIPEKEKNHYHVLLVKKRHVAKEQRYDVTGMVQTFGKGKAFEKIKKNFSTQGFSSLIILHDASQVKPDKKESLTGYEKSAIEKKIEKEEREAMEKRIKERKEQAIQDAADEKEKTSAPPKVDDDKNNTAIPPKPSSDNTEKPKEDVTEGPEGVDVGGVILDEKNIDDFIELNQIKTNAKTFSGKLSAVQKWHAEK